MNKLIHLCSYVLIACCIFCSCQTETKQPGKPYDIKVTPKLVLGASSFAGNIYAITGYAATNYVGGETNRSWPKRVHIELSLDGGSNYTRRIAYGVPSEGRWVNYEYSLPWWDRTILTENAKLRMINLEGEELGTSFPFVIAGIGIISPAEGEILTPGTFIDLSWYQYGAGTEVQMGYITPTNETWAPFMTWSNCVSGNNTVSWQVALPSGLYQIKLVLRSVLHPSNIGYSGVVSTP